MIKITTDRLMLREFTLDDTKIIYKLSREETLAKFMPDQVYDDTEEAERTLMYLIDQYRDISFPLVLAVTLKESDDLIGHVGLSRIKQGIEIGYAIGMDYQGKGYAKEAVKAFVNWAKTALYLDCIYGVVDKDNYSSIKVLESTGFSFQFKDTKGEFDEPDKRLIYTI